MSDHADIVREALRLSHRKTDAWDAAYAALDALVAERDAALGIETEVILDDLRATEKLATDERERRISAEAERDEAIACLQRVVEADRDDSRMGHPNAGDSCIGACIGLDVMPWLDQRGKLLPFVARAALGEDA